MSNLDPKNDPRINDALTAADAWVANPTDANLKRFADADAIATAIYGAGCIYNASVAAANPNRTE